MENICCGTFEKYALKFGWLTIYDENKQKVYLMPHIKIKNLKFRINYCPTCGADIRAVEIFQEKYDSLGKEI